MASNTAHVTSENLAPHVPSSDPLASNEDKVGRKIPEFELIEINGEPLSETILSDRGPY